MNIYRIIYLALLLCTLILYLTGSNRKEKYSKLVAGLMVAWLLTTISAIMIIRVFHFKSNLLVFHLTTVVEYVLLGWIYYLIITNQVVRRMILYSLFVFPVVCLFFSLYVQNTEQNNTYMIITESLLLIFLSLFYLRELLLFQPVAAIYRFPAFWICVGVLIYFTGNLLIECLLNYMNSHNEAMALRLYLIGYLFKWLLFICFIAGRLLQYKPEQLQNQIRALN